jgi:vacuolar-type H+-ATPase subunit I/STV1
MQNTIYTGRCWIPKYQEEKVYRSLSDLTKMKPDIAGAQLQEMKRPEKSKPPTYFQTNLFSKWF